MVLVLLLLLFTFLDLFVVLDLCVVPEFVKLLRTILPLVDTVATRANDLIGDCRNEWHKKVREIGDIIAEIDRSEAEYQHSMIGVLK